MARQWHGLGYSSTLCAQTLCLRSALAFPMPGTTNAAPMITSYIPELSRSFQFSKHELRQNQNQVSVVSRLCKGLLNILCNFTFFSCRPPSSSHNLVTLTRKVVPWWRRGSQKSCTHLRQYRTTAPRVDSEHRRAKLSHVDPA